MEQLQARGIIHIAAHLLADFVKIVIFLQNLAQHLNVVLGALLTEILQEEPFHIIKFGAFDVAVGLHHRSRQHQKSHVEVSLFLGIAKGFIHLRANDPRTVT